MENQKIFAIKFKFSDIIPIDHSHIDTTTLGGILAHEKTYTPSLTIIGLQPTSNYTPSAVTALQSAVLGAEYLSKSGTVDFLSGTRVVANNTFFTGTPVNDLSLILTTSNQVIADYEMYKNETSLILDPKFTCPRTTLIQAHETSNKITAIRLNYETLSGTSYVDNAFDLYPAIHSKVKNLPLIIYSTYDEVFNSFLQNLSNVILILSKEQKEKINKIGKEKFKQYIFKRLEKYFKKILFINKN